MADPLNADGRIPIRDWISEIKDLFPNVPTVGDYVEDPTQAPEPINAGVGTDVVSNDHVPPSPVEPRGALVRRHPKTSYDSGLRFDPLAADANDAKPPVIAVYNVPQRTNPLLSLLVQGRL